MTTRTYVAVRFKPWDRRTYTYHHEGPDPLAIGDAVRVETKDGVQVVEVTAVDLPPPAFETKAILGRFEPAPTPPAAA
jgi:hypothetical protein